jgi:hypothetical protein
MWQTYFATRSARPITAFLIMGSLMGFVVGQRLGHPAPVAQDLTIHTTVQHASGGLGTLVVHPLGQPLPVAAPATPGHKGDHGKEGKHGKPDGHGGPKDSGGQQSGPAGGPGGNNAGDGGSSN